MSLSDFRKYRDLVVDTIENFPYDADCDQDGQFDCTDYDGTYSFTLKEEVLTEDHPDYFFLWEVFDCLARSNDFQVLTSGEQRVDEFVKRYRDYRRSMLKKYGHNWYKQEKSNSLKFIQEEANGLS